MGWQKLDKLYFSCYQEMRDHSLTEQDWLMDSRRIEGGGVEFSLGLN